MNYYLVKYLIFENGRIVERDRISLRVAGFGSIDFFKEEIARIKNHTLGMASIVIQSYNQLTQSEFFSHTNKKE